MKHILTLTVSTLLAGFSGVCMALPCEQTHNTLSGLVGLDEKTAPSTQTSHQIRMNANADTRDSKRPTQILRSR